MELGTKIAIGVGGAAAVLLAGGALAASSRPEVEPDAPAGTGAGGEPSFDPTPVPVEPTPGPYPHPYDGSPVDPATDYAPIDVRRADAPVTSPGDEQISMPIRGTIDPPGFGRWSQVDGSLRGDRLDATIDPPGWGGNVDLTGRVDGGGFDTKADRWGWGNATTVQGHRTRDGGFEANVDRPGAWNDATLRISETIQGAQILREGVFDERLTPGFMEAGYRSEPLGTGGEGRVLEFDPPGWGNTTTVTLEGNVPAGVEATIASHLFADWKAEQERMDDYPDTPPSGGTAPGDDYYPGTGGGTTGPGDEY